jgi:hypothetical protein
LTHLPRDSELNRDTTLRLPRLGADVGGPHSVVLVCMHILYAFNCRRCRPLAPYAAPCAGGTVYPLRYEQGCTQEHAFGRKEPTQACPCIEAAPRGACTSMAHIALRRRSRRPLLLSLPHSACISTSAARARLPRRGRNENALQQHGGLTCRRARWRVVCEHGIMLGMGSRARARHGKHLRARHRRLHRQEVDQSPPSIDVAAAASASAADTAHIAPSCA